MCISSTPTSLSKTTLAAELNIGLLPILPGALEAVEAGIVSTLQGQNERDNAHNVQGGLAQKQQKQQEETEHGPGHCDEATTFNESRFRLLFDPQVKFVLIYFVVCLLFMGVLVLFVCCCLSLLSFVVVDRCLFVFCLLSLTAVCSPPPPSCVVFYLPSLCLL